MASPTDLAQLSALDTAINSGVLEIRFQDRVTKYQSTDDLLKARAALYNRIYPSNTRQTRIYTSKGF